MTDPKEHIKQLRTRQENTDPSLLKALAGAINRLEKAFPEQWHFLMEFLQNADDCQSSSFSFSEASCTLVKFDVIRCVRINNC